MAHFSFPQSILFKHCDPAGIGFYPRYVEIINDAVEALFGDFLGWTFAEIVKTGGVPTAMNTIPPWAMACAASVVKRRRPAAWLALTIGVRPGS